MEKKNRPEILYLVIPCYNEEAVLSETADALKITVEQMIQDKLISPDSRIVFVDDGSKDNTWSLIQSLTDSCTRFCGISLGRNVGHQTALYAGLMSVKNLCDISISMDADLQDDPALLPKMVLEYCSGYEIVNTVRNDRDCDSFFKKTTATLFYRFMNTLGVPMEEHGADFRLLSSDALEELSKLNEHNLFLRGLVPMIGLPSSTLSFDRKPRRYGESKYSVSRMLSLAADGIFTLSRRPLDFVLWTGLLCLLPSIIWFLFHLTADPGFGTVIASVWAVGGLLLIAVGIIGQYIGRIYQEVLGRPRYKIRETKNLKINSKLCDQED